MNASIFFTAVAAFHSRAGFDDRPGAPDAAAAARTQSVRAGSPGVAPTPGLPRWRAGGGGPAQVAAGAGLVVAPTCECGWSSGISSGVAPGTSMNRSG